MRRMAASPAERRLMGQQAQALVTERYHYEAVTAGTLSALRYVTRVEKP